MRIDNILKQKRFFPALIAFACGSLAGPLAVSASPCATSLEGKLPRTILFVDDNDVLYRAGTIKRPVVFTKHAENPVVAPEKPWEGMLGWTSVHRNPKTGKYQLWYQAYQVRYTEDKSLKCVVCYAESDDGINWIKPNLGLFPFYGEKNTNIVLIGAGGKEGGYGDRYGCAVVVNPDEKDPQKLYKMAYYDWATGQDARKGSGLFVAFSPDGIHWKKHPGMVLKTGFAGQGMQPAYSGEDFYHETPPNKAGLVRKSWLVPRAMSDAQDVVYDPVSEKYIMFGKMWYCGPDGALVWKHGMGRTESKDFIHWTKPDLVLTTDDRDPANLEFHTSPAFIYNGMYMSVNQVMVRKSTINTEFMSSRDGFHWTRAFPSVPPIPRGEGPVFDAGSILTNGTPVVTDTEVLFYYGAYRGSAVGGTGLGEQKIGGKDYHSGIGLARTPRDRFVGVETNPETPVRNQKPNQPKIRNTIGQVTLRAQDMAGVTAITLNLDATRRNASACVEILDEDGYRIRDFTKDDAIPVKGNGLAIEAKWRKKTLSDLPPGRYLVRVYLTEATLYAVTMR